MSTTTTTNKANLMNSTAGIGHNQPPSPDIGAIFKTAIADDRQADHKGTTATAKAAVAVLTWYDHKHGSTTLAHDLWKLSGTSGDTHFNSEMLKQFRASLYEELKITSPDSKGADKTSDSFKRASREFQRETKLIARGLEMASALVQPNGFNMSGMTAAEALSWFDNKRGMFVVPVERIMCRNQEPLGFLATMVAKDKDVRIALDGTWYSASIPGKEPENFTATDMRLYQAAKTKRVDPRKVVETDQTTGKTKTTTKDVVVEPVRQRAARAGGSQQGTNQTTASRPGNASAMPPAAAASGQLEFGKALAQAVNSIRAALKPENAQREGRGKDNYWSNDPLRTQIDEAINMLTAYRAEAMAFEARHRAEHDAIMIVGADAENAGAGKRTASK